MSRGIFEYDPCIGRFQEDAIRPWSSAIYGRPPGAGTVLWAVYAPTRGERSLQGFLERLRLS